MLLNTIENAKYDEMAHVLTVEAATKKRKTD
jgi:hypothetical protein